MLRLEKSRPLSKGTHVISYLLAKVKAQLHSSDVICAASISGICCFLQTKHKLTSIWQQAHCA